MGTQDNRKREEQIESLQDQLTAAVENLVTGDDWRRAIEFAARFRSRSFNNCLLIAKQHLDAYEQGRVPEPFPTYVAGFKQWQTLGRSVLKGQTSYEILAPRTARFASNNPTSVDGAWRRLARNEKPQPGETVRSRMIGVRVAHVWDVSQTDGAPLPTTPQPQVLRGQAPDGLWDGLADQITAEKFELRLVSNAAAIFGANGLTDFLTREVSVRVDMDDAAQTKTLCHELGHVLLTDPDDPDAPFHRGVAEVEAESVALMVGAAHGMDTSAYTVPYVATWANQVDGAEPAEVVQATAQRVRRAAIGILDRLDTPQTDGGVPPGLARSALAGERPQQDHGQDIAPRSEAVEL